MMFVRNPAGVSHSPGEHVEGADADAGAEALTTVLGNLLGDEPLTGPDDRPLRDWPVADICVTPF